MPPAISGDCFYVIYERDGTFILRREVIAAGKLMPEGDPLMASTIDEARLGIPQKFVDASNRVAFSQHGPVGAKLLEIWL